MSLNLVDKNLFFLLQDLESDIASALDAHFLRLSCESCEIDLAVLHAPFFLQIVLQLLDFLVERLLVCVFVVSVLQKLALQLEQLVVSHLATLDLPRQLVLEQRHRLEMVVLHHRLLFRNRVPLLLELVVREEETLDFFLQPRDFNVALEHAISRVYLCLLLHVV